MAWCWQSFYRDAEKETNKDNVLWENFWEAYSEGYNIENVVVLLKSVSEIENVFSRERTPSRNF